MPDDYNIGRVLGGQYKIESKIDSGGMGAVYQAIDLKLGNRKVAVKLMLGGGNTADQNESIGRFRREAEATARLEHKNIVRLYNADATSNGEPYLVMELLRGEDLQRRLRRTGPLPPTEAITIVLQVLSGLAAAHRAGIVHRDLKPSNIFLVRDTDEESDTAKVMDFGIAAMQGATKLTRTGRIYGSAPYLSPEQARGKSADADARSDLYSIGVILYELLTGALPFHGESHYAYISAHLYDPPRRLREGAPHLPELREFEALLDRLLAKDADDRFSNVQELAAELRRIQGLLTKPALPTAGDDDIQIDIDWDLFATTTTKMPPPSEDAQLVESEVGGPLDASTVSKSLDDASVKRRRMVTGVLTLSGALIAFLATRWLIPPRVEETAFAALATSAPSTPNSFVAVDGGMPVQDVTDRPDKPLEEAPIANEPAPPRSIEAPKLSSRIHATVSPALPEAPSRDETIAAMRGVEWAVRACNSGPDAPTGTAEVKLMVAGSTGRVAAVKVTGITDNINACIERAVHNARFPRFSKPTFTILYPYRF